MKPPPGQKLAPIANPTVDITPSDCVRSHLRWAWWSLVVFLTLGIALETLHGFKVGWYLNVSTQTRRLLFTLAHAHGTLLGLVHVAFSVTVGHLPGWDRTLAVASASLKAATVLLPGGFFLGGLIIHQGDPGLGILLVPAGALLLLITAFLSARALTPPGSAPQGRE